MQTLLFNLDTEEFPEHIDISIAVKIVRKIGRKYSPESIMTIGGEPLLFPKIICAIHKEAMDVGIPSEEELQTVIGQKIIKRLKILPRT